jgi:hypothetical protein
VRKFLTIATPLMLAIPAAHAQPPAHNGERMFAMMDANGDGKIDKDEIAKMMQMRAERMRKARAAAPPPAAPADGADQSESN